MVTMFIRHEPGRFSRLVKREGTWQPEEITSIRTIDHLEALFDAVSKQVVQGDYVLPLPALEAKP